MANSFHPARGQRSPALRAAAFATGTVVAGAALIGAAPVHQPALPDAVPVVQVQDVELTSFGFDDPGGFDPTPFITSMEKVFVHILLGLTRITGVGDLTTPELLDKIGLGGVTPNELLQHTGLGGVSLDHLAGFAGMGHNPVSVLLAATGFSDATTLPQAATNLGITDLPLSNLYDLIGMPNYLDDSLGDLAHHLGLADGPISNLYGLIGLSGSSTLDDVVQALGIGDTPVDTLLDDWGVGAMGIEGYLQGLGVSPSELFGYLNVDPSTLPASIWDPGTDAFTAGATVQQFADAAGLGHDTALQLLGINDLGGASLNDAVHGIGLGPDASVTDVLHTIGFNDLSLANFFDGIGLEYGEPGYTTTVGDLFAAIPGFDDGTLGALLGAVGLGDHSTINDLLTAVPGIGANSLNDFVGVFGLGDEHLSDIASTLLGTTTVEDYLTGILNAL